MLSQHSKKKFKQTCVYSLSPRDAIFDDEYLTLTLHLHAIDFSSFETARFSLSINNNQSLFKNESNVFVTSETHEKICALLSILNAWCKDFPNEYLVFYAIWLNQ